MDERRAARYERLIEQLRDLIVGKSPTLQAAMATVCAVLHAKMRHHSWIGFYFVAGDDEPPTVGSHVGPGQKAGVGDLADEDKDGSRAYLFSGTGLSVSDGHRFELAGCPMEFDGFGVETDVYLWM